MIEIRNRHTNDVLHRVDADTLKRADLRDVDLRDADLEQADLRKADLRKADLREAHLDGAALVFADLSGADLSGADLIGANLGGAYLGCADLYQANLCEADLNSAWVMLTYFAILDTLHQAKNLDKVMHGGPSTIDRHTLQHSIHALPDVFLEGCGYTQHEIGCLRSLYGKGIQFYSCFVSRAGPDAEFAERLVADLKAQYVSCWHYTQDMRGGRNQDDQINRAIKVHDKLLLICSRSSNYRPNVVREIYRAIHEQNETGAQKLFPIMLDDHILSDEMLESGREAAEQFKTLCNWVREIRKKHIPDFSGWRDHDTYKREFDKLIRDLKRDPDYPAA